MEEGQIIMFGFKAVHVTQDDIDKGRAYDSRYCPVARALERTCKDSYSVGTIVARKVGSKEEVLLPKYVTRFIRAFDNDKGFGAGRASVKPFWFLFRCA